MNTQKLSYENLDSDQLYGIFYKDIFDEFEKNGMQKPFTYKSTNDEINVLYENEFLINSEIDVEVTALELSKFPYGVVNKYSLGDFFRTCDLINRARSRYIESDGFTSFKDFYENCEEAIFDKVKSHLPTNFSQVDFTLTKVDPIIIRNSEDLIRAYGYPGPMNYLESEFNKTIVDYFIIYQKNNLPFDGFRDVIEDMRLFLRSYQNSMLKGINVSNLVTLDQLMEEELSCSYY